jgi:hypothetical protein
MKHTIFENLERNDGNILVVTLLILFAISVIGGTLAMVSSVDLKISGNQRTTVQALFVAEAGMNEAIHRLSLPNPTNVSVGGWTGNAAIGDSEPYDPNWTMRIYLTSPDAAPPGGGSVYTTGTLQNPNRPYLDYSMPDGNNRVLTIQHKWRDLDGDGSRDANEIIRYDALQVPPENFTSGYPVEIVAVTGQFSAGTRMIQAEVTKRTMVARILGALYVDKAVKLTGNCAFCGFNHDIAIAPGTKPNGCLGMHLVSGNLPGVTSTGDQVKVQGSADVLGDPTPIDNSSTNPFYSLSEVLGMADFEVNELLANADNRTIVNPLNGITYIIGDANITSNLAGEGLIYVTGDLHAAGSFRYVGLIFVEGDVHFTGTPWILGGMVVRGTSDFNFSSGNAGVLYSKDAITRALTRSMPCIVLTWREI